MSVLKIRALYTFRVICVVFLVLSFAFLCSDLWDANTEKVVHWLACVLMWALNWSWINRELHRQRWIVAGCPE
jgi:cytochrome bd-type quinol oxidase subunit 1